MTLPRASRTAWASPWPTPTWPWRRRSGPGSTAWRAGSSPRPATESPYAATAALLPASLAEALDALAADGVLQQGLGEPMARVFHAIKRQELARHAQADDAAAWERREYFGRF